MYESCFGSEVVREVRKEMKMANAKCNGMAQSGIYPSNIGGNILKNPIALIIQSNKHQNDNLYSPEHLKSQTSSNIDLNKLQQAIFTGFNKAIFVSKKKIKQKKQRNFIIFFIDIFRKSKS